MPDLFRFTPYTQTALVPPAAEEAQQHENCATDIEFDRAVLDHAFKVVSKAEIREMKERKGHV